MLRLGSLIGVGTLLAVFACSSDDASNGAPATGDAGADAQPAVCNMLANDGPVVTVTASTAAAPTPAGGMVTDGTYVLSAATVFGQAAIPPTTSQAVIQIAGNIMQQVGALNGAESRYTSTFTTSGSSVSTTDTCPAPMSSTHRFTATPTTLRIYDTSAIGTVEQTYTKR